MHGDIRSASQLPRTLQAHELALSARNIKENQSRKEDTKISVSESIPLPPAREHRYSAVVLYYRLGEAFSQTLTSLLRQTQLPEEIVVVDNYSRDGIAREIVQEIAGQARVPIAYYETPYNKGYAGGMNAGSQRLSESAEFILFMTHEVLLDEDCVALMLSNCAEFGHVLVGPELLRTKSHETWSEGGEITRLGDVRHLVHRNTRTPQWLDGACLLANRDVLSEVSGFDEEYFLYWEDVDVSVRMQQRGTINCVDGAQAWQDTATAPVYYRLRNQVLFWRKHEKRLVLAAVAIAWLKIIVRDLPAANWTVSKVRIVAMADGLTGRLRNEYGRVYER